MLCFIVKKLRESKTAIMQIISFSALCSLCAKNHKFCECIHLLQAKM